MVIKPYGYAIWEAIQRALDERIKATGHENVYFPLLVPSTVLDRERELVEGFAPEVAVVTHAGGKKLEEPLVVRPTSEAVIWATYAGWVQSYRDLPLLYNQWANVVRWELRPRLFLRTTEFLWQEGHTAHETSDEAMAEALRILHDVYADTAEQVLAIPVLRGRKSASERFPGAVETFAIEALMRDGKALQAGTAHYLGQNFARAYGVRFTGRDGKEQYAYATSWGASTRLVGGLIMAHGDDSGLRLPPAVAPYQIVIVPISSVDGWTRVREASAGLATTLRAAGLRVRLDDREETRPGFKFNEWEHKGVPLRLELGERELDDRLATLVRRDTGAKERTSMDGAASRARELLAEIQRRLLEEALAFRAEHTLENPKSYDVMREFLEAARGLAVAPWCGSPTCEDRVKSEARATIRCLPLTPVSIKARCIVCESPAVDRATWSQAY
jgi:prolyl-tRNA synthetase